MRRGVVYHLSYIAVIGFPLGRKMALCIDPQLPMKVRLNHRGRLPPVHFRTNVMQRCDSAVCVCLVCLITLYSWWSVACLCFFLRQHSCVCVCFFARDRIVCEMAAAPQGSAPGPVKLCVGECRPELRAQSSQLYSFVVTSDTETHSLCPENEHQVFAMQRTGWIGWKANDRLDQFRPLQLCTT